MGTADDAGVYRISDDLALIQTVDFLRPLLMIPMILAVLPPPMRCPMSMPWGDSQNRHESGGVSSGVHGFGGFEKILAGGIHILEESGTVLLGGHSVEDDELKYGLSVTGFVHPDRILANQGLNPVTGWFSQNPGHRCHEHRSQSRAGFPGPDP